MLGTIPVAAHWNWHGIVAYAAGFLSMLPFMYLSFYQGFAAVWLQGVDIAFFVGIPVAGLVYLVLSRNLDVNREIAVIAEADRDLDSIAAPVE